jgi:hypothetical protein
MAKPVLLVTRKLPEAIEARAAQDYDARLNPKNAPWATDGAECSALASSAEPAPSCKSAISTRRTSAAACRRSTANRPSPALVAT